MFTFYTKQDWLSPVYSGHLETWCIDALLGVKIPFQSQVQSPEGNPDSIPPVQSPVHVYTGHRTPVGNWNPRPSYDSKHPMTASSHLTLFRLVGLSKRKIIEPYLTAFTGFPFALVLRRTKRPETKTKTKKHTHQVHSVPSGPSN